MTDEQSLAELAAEITGAAVRMAAATAAWLLLVGEFDRREGWAGPGMTSCALACLAVRALAGGRP